MKRKRRGFKTFLCSLIPGAAEMYMGFMKKGISMMAIFILCIVVPSILQVVDVFILFAVLVWFYSFFHARNLAACTEEEIQTLTDEYVWTSFMGEKERKFSSSVLRKWGSIALIVCGVVLLWRTISRLLYILIPDHLWNVVAGFVDEVPQVMLAVIIIIVGFKLIAGKKEAVYGEGK